MIMDQLKRFSGRSLLWITFLSIVMVIALDFLLYQGLSMMTIKAGETTALSEGLTFDEGLAQYLFLKIWFLKVFAPGSLAVAVFFGLIAWMVVRLIFKLSVTTTESAAKAQPSAKPSQNEIQIEENMKKRLFVHVLSTLQKEGRLLDFFNEKLDQFDDAQIGAAVRQVHDNCTKTLGKYLSLEPVMDVNEGETVTIQAGFDPAEVKLTGNVVGNPPFKGVLRHKGWKTSKLAIPTLSKQENPGIIAPAEVEIE